MSNIVRTIQKRITFKQIFSEQWEPFKSENKIRPVVEKEVEKMLKCKEISNGFMEYLCPHCGERKKVAFTCKSRFCTSCGKVYIDEWVGELCTQLLDVGHRHMVFTIPEELRETFLRDRKLLKVLSDCAANTVQRTVRIRAKKRELEAGVVAVIHTFGRDLKWNPHVHLIVTEGGLGNDHIWTEIKFFSYEQLRKSWQHGLLLELKKRLKKTRENKELINRMYSYNTEGFYVYAKNRLKDSLGAARYIGRYTGRPAMAESRLISYDGENVRFWYESHESKDRIEVEMSASEFIGKLVRHIPERHFKMVRYYGIYSRNRKRKVQKVMSVWKRYKQVVYKRASWRSRIKKAFGYDPLNCSKCGHQMEMNDIVYPKYGSLLAIMARRAEIAYEKEIEYLKQKLGGETPQWGYLSVS
jgi:hypothetical protein